MIATAELRDVDLSEVEDAVGARSFGRGRAYARRGRVLRVRWEGDETLTGAVAGEGGLYDTAAFSSRDATPRSAARRTRR